MHVLTLLSFIAILLSSCVETTPNYYHPTAQSWQGAQASSLVNVWGNPDQKITNFNGNTVYIYRRTNYPHGPAWNTQPSAQSAQKMTPYSSACITAYEVDKTGEIIGVQVQGHGCLASKAFLHEKRNPAKNEAHGVKG